jgi:hypothetical protein
MLKTLPTVEDEDDEDVDGELSKSCDQWDPALPLFLLLLVFPSLSKPSEYAGQVGRMQE